ncbi:MAG: phosphoribosylamine--glycine ligase [Anaeroplasmataceae bacterium]
MKVLVIGSGGRCHAIVHSLSKSNQISQIYCAPGNDGMKDLATLINIHETDIESLLNFAKEEMIDLTVVGPEISLAAGVVNLFEEHNMRIFGPTKEAARIESSKEFAKDLMKKYEIPTAEYKVFSDYNLAIEYINNNNTYPIVLKYDGLAAGKGVVIAESFKEASDTLKDMLVNDKFGKSSVVIEEFLTGPEFSFMCFVSGKKVFRMALSQDHKRAYENDKGPNTGGMGCFSPLPFITEEDIEYSLNHIMIPTAKALIKEGCPFKGVLYGGLMKTPTGIKVIEFNARFGDPETEVVLPRLKTDIVDVFNAVIDGEDIKLSWSTKYTCGIVLASKGYPDAYKKNIEIKGLDKIESLVYHMGTKKQDSNFYSNGGRVLIIVAKEKTLLEARNKCIEEIKKIEGNDFFYRSDIGLKIL